MAMNLFDRPSLAHEALDPGHRGVTALGSITLHAAIALTLLVGLRVASRTEEQVQTPARLLPDHLIWMPSSAPGGGRAGGGDNNSGPAQPLQMIGHDAVSVPSAPSPSLDLTSPPPPENVAAIPARAMGDATLAYAGTIDGDPASTSAGPGAKGTGDSISTNRGSGEQPHDGFGSDAIAGGPGVTIPMPIERISPRYTIDAMRAGIQGSVWIECVVLPDGSVGDARVMRSLDRRFGLDEEAIAAAKRWRFRPGLLNGKPVPVIVTMELMFSVR